MWRNNRSRTWILIDISVAGPGMGFPGQFPPGMMPPMGMPGMPPRGFRGGPPPPFMRGDRRGPPGMPPFRGPPPPGMHFPRKSFDSCAVLLSALTNVDHAAGSDPRERDDDRRDRRDHRPCKYRIYFSATPVEKFIKIIIDSIRFNIFYADLCLVIVLLTMCF